MLEALLNKASTPWMASLYYSRMGTGSIVFFSDYEAEALAGLYKGGN